MIKPRFLVATAAAASLAAAPVVSAAAADRPAAPVSGQSQLGGDGGLWFVAIGVLAAFIAITIINADDDEDEPASP